MYKSGINFCKTLGVFHNFHRNAMKRSPSRYTAIAKGTKFHKKSQKSVSAYCWVVHSSSKSWYKSY